MKDESLKVFAPALSSDFAFSYGNFSFSLEKPGDEVLVNLTDNPGVTIKRITGSENKNFAKNQKNPVVLAVQAYLEYLEERVIIKMKAVKTDLKMEKELKQENLLILINLIKDIKDIGVELEIHRKTENFKEDGLINCCVAAVYAVNKLLGEPLVKKELLQACLFGDKLSWNSANISNAASILLGGFILIESSKPLKFTQIIAKKLYIVLAVSEIKIEFVKIKKPVLENINLLQITQQSASFSALVLGLERGDEEMIKSALSERQTEEASKNFSIPNFNAVCSAAIKAGALGCSFSSSKSCLFALCDSQKIAKSVAEVMNVELQKSGLKNKIYTSKINQEGVIEK